jgi:3-deoxy-D-manno-octulosonic-acid transferase
MTPVLMPLMMMTLSRLNTLLLGLYNGLLVISSPLLFLFAVVMCWRMPKVRAGFWQKLGLAGWHLPPCPEGHHRLWIHCVSVGEWNAIQPLLKRLSQQSLSQQSYQVVVTTTTKTGYALASSRYPIVFYCPYDLPWAVARWLRQCRPDLTLVVETELWPNLLAQARAYGPVAVINGRLSAASFKGYRRVGGLSRFLVQLPHAILAQSPEDAYRFTTLGAQHVTVMGNLKFDITPTIDDTTRQHWQQRLTSTLDNGLVVVLASTHSGEETLLLPAIQLLLQHPHIRVVVAPRHPERGADVAHLLQTLNVPVVQQSEHTNASPCDSGPPLAPDEVLVLDTIGQLLGVYSASDLVVMGGSFVPWGGQNPLEPLAIGVPVITGPHMHNFKAIMAALLACNGVHQVSDVDALQLILSDWLAQPDCLRPSVARAQACITQSQGAANVVAQWVQQTLDGI